jgi:phage terminase large subunit-like protein
VSRAASKSDRLFRLVGAAIHDHRPIGVVGVVGIGSLAKSSPRLFSTRERFPEHSAELTARLLEIGTELAELMAKFPAAPLGDWV